MRTFFAGLCPQCFGQVVGLQYGLGKAKKLFFWGKGFFALPRLISRPQKGVWGMNAGGICFKFFGGGNFLNYKIVEKEKGAKR